ncbi:hypothetical protein EVAR_56984_1 [Eumeta japonica]|uniref:Uncharacterized protein n=1 Tax=Eumeta variegata TaxID=151549 RepID=A0A4C1Z8T5_EUMVA|nr:hypothetical protein EVAR_56984_1 [Eumeta japonica]
MQDVYKRREEDFQNNLDNLFDIAHANALEWIKIEEDKIFLQKQREPRRPGCLAGVDKKLAEKEDKTRQRKLKEGKKRQEQMCSESLSSSLTTEDFIETQENPNQPTSSDESFEEPLPSTSQMVSSVTTSKRGTKDFMTPKSVAALDRCQLSIRDSVYIRQAVVEALDLSCNEFPINKSSIQRNHTQSRKYRAVAINLDFQNKLPETVTVHCDGKLLSGLNVRSSKEERLSILISFGEKEQLLAVLKLESSSGQDQAKAVLTALHEETSRTNLAVNAPNQDLRFLKNLKEYETVNKEISKAALSKFSQHLCVTDSTTGKYSSARPLCYKSVHFNYTKVLCMSQRTFLSWYDQFSQLDLIDGAVVGMSNSWTDWDENFYVYSNGSLDDFKTQLDPVSDAAVVVPCLKQDIQLSDPDVVTSLVMTVASRPRPSLDQPGGLTIH